MLLVEYTLLDDLQVINENTTGGVTKLKLRGRFQKCDEQNNNGRIYPRKILEGQVQRIQEKIKDRSLVGALDHPANDAIHLSQASHLITGLSVDKTGDVIGECEILSTPNGKIVESLIKDGVKIGISSRGVGSVSEGREGKIVNEDFKLITFDLVSDPSTKGAFPELTESIRENSERAQAIVSKHKKDRVLMTMLESKVNQKLMEAKKDKDPLRLKLLAGQKPAGSKPSKKKSMEEGSIKDDPEAFKKAKAKAEKKQTTIAQDIQSASEESKRRDAAQKARINKGLTKDKRTIMQKAGLKRDAKGKAVAREDSSIDIRATVLEAFKKVCWGDRYDEGEVKRRNKRRRQAMETRAGAQRPSLDTPDTARSKAYDALKGDFSGVAKSYLKAKEHGRSGEAAAARARARATGVRVPVKPKPKKK